MSPAFRADHHRGSPSVLLGRVLRTKPNALHWWTVGRLAGSPQLMGDLGTARSMARGSSATLKSLNPANTAGRRLHLYSKVDAEAPRYLEFERWWATMFLLNAAAT